MAQHKWHKEIKAWADGEEIEFRSTLDDIWDDVKGNPLWETREDWEYRIKPQPKETQYLYVYKINGIVRMVENGGYIELHHKDDHVTYIGKIKLEVDD